MVTTRADPLRPRRRRHGGGAVFRFALSPFVFPVVGKDTARRDA